MRILFVWTVAFVLLLTITLSWYLGMAMIVQLGLQAADLVTTGQGNSLIGLIQVCSVAWGPIFDIVVVIWAIASSGVTTTQSEMF